MFRTEQQKVLQKSSLKIPSDFHRPTFVPFMWMHGFENLETYFRYECLESSLEYSIAFTNSWGVSLVKFLNKHPYLSITHNPYIFYHSKSFVVCFCIYIKPH